MYGCTDILLNEECGCYLKKIIHIDENADCEYFVDEAVRKHVLESDLKDIGLDVEDYERRLRYLRKRRTILEATSKISIDNKQQKMYTI